MAHTMADSRQQIDTKPMTSVQWMIVGLTVLFSAVDGFDVLAIAVSGSGIMREFGLDREGLGLVLSMELIGMAIGSIVFGSVADKLGRKGMLLVCLLIMASGMWAASYATSIEVLSAVRIYTGLGIGGLLSSTNAVVAEFSNQKHRGLCISLMVIGYPLGGIACGAIGHSLLGEQGADWRDMFTFGAWLSLALFPLTWFLLPESVHWLARVQPKNALLRVNKTLRQLGHSDVSELPILRTEQEKRSFSAIFTQGLLISTLLMTLAYLFQMLTFYYILKWTPTIVVQMGIGAGKAAGVLFWVNVGGVLGGLSFGFLSHRMGLKRLTIGILVLTCFAVSLFGQASADLVQLSALAAAAGFFANAGVSGIYTLMAVVFPTHVRATGTGFVIGMGRAGAILSPWLAGILMQHGVERGDELADILAYVALVMGLCSLGAALCLIFLSVKSRVSQRVLA